MAAGTKQMWKDMRRNRPAKYDKLIRQNAVADMTSFRRKPYYLQQEQVVQCRESKYSYPFSIGDEVYELYAGNIYPLKVVGFYIIEQGEYAIVQDASQKTGEMRIALQNIFLSRKQAQEEMERRQGIC